VFPLFFLRRIGLFAKGPITYAIIANKRNKPPMPALQSAKAAIPGEREEYC